VQRHLCLLEGGNVAVIGCGIIRDFKETAAKQSIKLASVDAPYGSWGTDSRGRLGLAVCPYSASAQFEGARARKGFLDEVMADRPVILVDESVHLAVANSKALEMAGITKGTPRASVLL
jgi:predicted amidohydrolase YtcJ